MASQPMPVTELPTAEPMEPKDPNSLFAMAKSVGSGAGGISRRLCAVRFGHPRWWTQRVTTAKP